jgi:hypothetical protein
VPRERPRHSNTTTHPQVDGIEWRSVFVINPSQTSTPAVPVTQDDSTPLTYRSGLLQPLPSSPPADQTIAVVNKSIADLMTDDSTPLTQLSRVLSHHRPQIVVPTPSLTAAETTSKRPFFAPATAKRPVHAKREPPDIVPPILQPPSEEDGKSSKEKWQEEEEELRL